MLDNFMGISKLLFYDSRYFNYFVQPLYIEYMIRKYVLLIHAVKWLNSSISKNSILHELNGS